jgi:cystathionine gamma-synthase
MVDPSEVTPATWAIAGGRPSGAPGEPLNVSPFLASNFVLGTDRIYARNEATPGWEAFEEVIGGLEGGIAVAFASGMGACAGVFFGLPTGAHVVLPDDCYQGVVELAAAGAAAHGWQLERLAVTDPAWPDRVGTADVIWVESPSNPMLEIADLEAICAAPRGDRPARPRVVVDNTFATPLLQQPLALGADVVVHSATKFIGGHSDLMLGVAVVGSDGHAAQLRRARSVAGATPGALEVYLALRGVRTLPLRFERACSTASRLAERLGTHPAVARVRYPGTGAIVSFELASAQVADRACATTRLIRHATSLGGVETSMERRSTHPGQGHIPPGLIRMSVGCEDPEDLWRDLQAALDAGVVSTDV